MMQNKDLYINGDGVTSRGFCYIDNTVQANLLATMDEAEQGTSDRLLPDAGVVGQQVAFIKYMFGIREQIAQATNQSP